MKRKSENKNQTNKTALKKSSQISKYPEDSQVGFSGILNSGATQDTSKQAYFLPNSTSLPEINFHVFQYIILFLITLSPFIANCQCDNQDKGGQIKIITWNIYMLPRVFIHTGQVERAKEIADTLKNADADIIVFEEAFDNKARNIIRDNLKAYFPYESGDPRKNSWWKTSCGVWIISKVPIEVVKQIFYKEANGSDRLATKGAILVEGQKDGFCFRLVGTHLQSDLNSGKNVQPLRDKQYAELKQQLLEPYSNDNIPQFVAGDFNTIHDDSACYNHMVGTLKFTPCELNGDKCFSYDYTRNDLVIGTNNKPQLIDYLLYSAAPHQQLHGNMQIVVFSKRWNDKHKDLSDHFAVAGVFSYGESNSTAYTGTR
jgi:endonuclease/exonuclease/phosphatase family metal-dependent hydrolase